MEYKLTIVVANLYKLTIAVLKSYLSSIIY